MNSFIFAISHISWKILFIARHRLYARILLASRVHSPWNVFTRTLSTFSCPTSCENMFSTHHRFLKISWRMSLLRLILLTVRAFQCHKADTLFGHALREGFASGTVRLWVTSGSAKRLYSSSIMT